MKRKALVTAVAIHKAYESPMVSQAGSFEWAKETGITYIHLMRNSSLSNFTFRMHSNNEFYNKECDWWEGRLPCCLTRKPWIMHLACKTNMVSTSIIATESGCAILHAVVCKIKCPSCFDLNDDGLQMYETDSHPTGKNHFGNYTRLQRFRFFRSKVDVGY